MKRRIAGWLLMVAAMAAVSGCSKPGLTGSWTGSMGSGMSHATIDLSFTQDGKFTQTMSGGGMAVVASGTYTTKDDALLMTPLSATVNGVTRSAPARTVVRFTYKVDGDKLTMTESSGVQSTTLTRVKK